MAGLLANFGRWTGDPDRDSAINQGLLGAAMSLMQGRGTLGQSIGGAGLQGIGMFQQAMQDAQGRRLRELQMRSLEEQMRAQSASRTRQETLQALPRQFQRSTNPAEILAGGEPNRAGFDFPGLSNAYASQGELGLAAQARTFDQMPKRNLTSLAPGASLVDETTGQPVFTAPKLAQDLPPGMRMGAKGPEWIPGYLEGKERINKAGASNMTLPKIEVKTGESIAGQIGPMMRESREKAVAGVRLVDSAKRILDAAIAGNVFAGPGANLRLRGAQAADVLGLGGKSTAEKIANTRSVVRGMAEQAVAARSQLGGQAQISNDEQALLTKATAGDIAELTVAEIVLIARLNDRLGRTLYAEHETNMRTMGENPALHGVRPFYTAPSIPTESNRIIDFNSLR